MTGFTLHAPDVTPEGSRKALAAVNKARGFTCRLLAILAGCPVALKAFKSNPAFAQTAAWRAA